MQSKISMFLLGATLALGFAFSSYLLSGAIAKFKRVEAIKVKGYSSVNVTSDTGSWCARFAVRHENLQDAYSSLEKNRNKVKEFLAAEGISRDEISFDSVSTSLNYKLNEKGNRTNEIERYFLRQSVEVTTDNVSKLDMISKKITELIKDGIEVESYSPSYLIKSIDSVKIDLLAKATRNGYERAKTLAANSNGRVGKLISASQGVFQITPVNSTEVSSYGVYNTRTIEKCVKAVVTLEFGVGK